MKMKLTIIHYTVLVLVFVGLFVLKTRRAHAQTTQQTNALAKKGQRAVAIDATPDDPTPFGYKCMWFAVKTTNGEDVVKEISLKSAQRCNWRTGVAAAYEGSIFVTPSVNGWTLIVGQDLPTLDDDERRKQTEALLVKLCERFGEAQHYGTHRVVGFHAWVRSVGGKITREYAYLGERGERLHDSGNITSEEKAVGIKSDSSFFPNESHVMKVAGKWSLDPTELSPKSGSKGIGWLGRL